MGCTISMQRIGLTKCRHSTSTKKGRLFKSNESAVAKGETVILVMTFTGAREGAAFRIHVDD